jgi:type II secretory pathway component GspD/PulD (secretin)
MLARFLLSSLPVALLLTPLAAAAAPKCKGQVQIEVRFITVAEDCFERIGVDFSHGAKEVVQTKAGEVGELHNPEPIASRKPVFLDEQQLRKFMETIQGDVRANVMQAPRMMVTNGKKAVLRCMDEHPGTNDEPHKESISTGLELAVQPTISADKQFVALDLNASMSQLASQSPPRVQTHSLELNTTIPNGHTALVGGWKQIVEARFEYGPPVLSKIPYLNRLFRTVGYTRLTENVLVMVTATVVPQNTKPAKRACSSVNAPKPMACPQQASPTVSDPMQDLRALVDVLMSRLKEAKKLARQALELDPACFDDR